ncbi:hypothetical protein XBKB1_3480001 [Xenorhabdus bovienii str. kraussei Becker Underwood]|uniref:Uncharacterized protein n=1 Tax=Xenorhabdus bovienii str. kraussei Becker Underwood TaxID=1398204 RepID=A0A077PWB0_XENBV|nr:hypothetical protein XBKB1_3480001 [Xenorhabdus bovienii str. kraussei Becker Underwood]
MARFCFKRRREINYKDSLSLRNHQSQRLNYEIFVVYIFTNWDLKAHLSGNAHFSDNSLIFNQTPDLAFAYTLSVSDTDSQTLRVSFSDAQKEKVLRIILKASF